MKFMKLGTHGVEVEELQINLSRLGFYTQCDGAFGPLTEASLKHFQVANFLKDDGIYGPITDRVMIHKLGEVPQTQTPSPVSDSETPWMDWMERSIGQKEIPGNAANPFIVDVFRYTSLKNTKYALTDETPWCAACVNAALVKNGYQGTNSAAVYSFNKYGTELKTPKYGAIIVLGYHVTFFKELGPHGYYSCLGGNQADKVKVSNFPIHDVQTIRWPVAL